MRAVALIIAIVLVFAIAYLLLAPARVDPVAYNASPSMALEGALAPNEEMRHVEIVGAGRISGPEDVDVDAQGRIYGGTLDGRIVRVLDDGTVETFAETGGRPLGLHFDAAGNLIVADGVKGLLSISPAGQVSTLTTAAAGVPFGFTNDVEIAPDGQIYFSDASSRWGVQDYLYDLLEGRPYGRLLRYDPATKTTTVIGDGLYFANGVAVARDGSFVIVNETWPYRIQRYWIAGPKAGTHDVFIDGLPGFPDGVSQSGRGTFWVACFTVRNASADFLSPKPFLKRLMSKLPRALWPKSERYGLVIEIDEGGRIRRSLHDPGGKVLFEVTSAQEHGDKLYLGSLHNDRIGVYRLR